MTFACGFPLHWTELSRHFRDPVKGFHDATRGSILQGHWLPAFRRKLFLSFLEVVNGSIDVPALNMTTDGTNISPLPNLQLPFCSASRAGLSAGEPLRDQDWRRRPALQGGSYPANARLGNGLAMA